MINYLCTALAVLTIGGGDASSAESGAPAPDTPEVSVSAEESSIGRLEGVVTDTAGRPIADAKLEIIDSVTQTTWSFRTSANGEFKIDSLVPSQKYSLLVTRLGYKGMLVETVIPKLDTPFRMQVTLRPREVVILPATSTTPRIPASRVLAPRISAVPASK